MGSTDVLTILHDVLTILHNELADHGIERDEVPFCLNEWIEDISGHFERGIIQSQIFDAWRTESELLFRKTRDAIEAAYRDGNEGVKGERKVDYLSYVYTSWKRIVQVYRIRLE